MANLASIDEQVDHLLADYFQRLSAGQDVSPADRFRLEGYLRAIVSFELMPEATLLGLKHKYIASEAVSDLPSLSWQLPFKMTAAPVKPSTAVD